MSRAEVISAVQSIADKNNTLTTKEEAAMLKFIHDNFNELQRIFSELRTTFRDEPDSGITNILEG